MPKCHRCVCTTRRVGLGCQEASFSKHRGVELTEMRRIIYASAAAAVLASSTGCQQCWDSMRRFEAWKFQTVFGHSPTAYSQTLAMPATVAAPICEPIDACSPGPAIAAPATVLTPSAGCPCDGGTLSAPTLPGTLQSSTILTPGTFVPATPGPTQ